MGKESNYTTLFSRLFTSRVTLSTHWHQSHCDNDYRKAAAQAKTGGCPIFDGHVQDREKVAEVLFCPSEQQ